MAMAASTETEHPRTPHRPSNEYVLGVAFYSFIGFVAVQAVFAIIANSQAMLADSEAMSVDAFTYLFNLVAERYKNRPLSDEEHQLSPTLVEYRREMQRLYLELVPPSISVVALVAVTALTLREATSTLRGEEEGDDDNVSISIMLIFSAANLLLDILNVTIFAQAGFNFGLDVVRQEGHSIRESIRDSFQFTATTKEGMRLLQEGQGSASYTEDSEPMDVDRISSSIMTPRKRHHLINLNMCSAWTHVCADTLRSIAVLIAAGIASVFTSIDGSVADSVAAIVVSGIILVSLIPLLQGLILTALEILAMHRHPPEEADEDTA